MRKESDAVIVNAGQGSIKISSGDDPTSAAGPQNGEAADGLLSQHADLPERGG